MVSAPTNTVVASAWRAIRDPDARLEAALGELYAYYEALEPLLANIQRDAPVMPLVAEMNGYRVRYLEEVRDVLLAGRRNDESFDIA